MWGLPENLGSSMVQNVRSYTIKDWIRIIIIVGGYALMRAQYVRWRTIKYQMKQDLEDQKLKKEAEEEAKREALEKEEAKLRVLNEYGAGVDLPGSSGPTPAVTTTSRKGAFGWGNAAKERHANRRKYAQSIARRKAEMAQQDDSDDEISDLLH